jgi:hypothetical protein
VSAIGHHEYADHGRARDLFGQTAPQPKALTRPGEGFDEGEDVCGAAPGHRSDCVHVLFPRQPSRQADRSEQRHAASLVVLGH